MDARKSETKLDYRQSTICRRGDLGEQTRVIALVAYPARGPVLLRIRRLRRPGPNPVFLTFFETKNVIFVLEETTQTQKRNLKTLSFSINFGYM